MRDTRIVSRKANCFKLLLVYSLTSIGTTRSSCINGLRSANYGYTVTNVIFLLFHFSIFFVFSFLFSICFLVFYRVMHVMQGLARSAKHCASRGIGIAIATRRAVCLVIPSVTLTYRGHISSIMARLII